MLYNRHDDASAAIPPPEQLIIITVMKNNNHRRSGSLVLHEAPTPTTNDECKNIRIAHACLAYSGTHVTNALRCHIVVSTYCRTDDESHTNKCQHRAQGTHKGQCVTLGGMSWYKLSFEAINEKSIKVITIHVRAVTLNGWARCHINSLRWVTMTAA